MTHGHVHEEAEHASHHAENPFDKWVALTMVVIAALLAGVKVVAHRTHNDTLAYQIKAGNEQSKAGREGGEANTWHTKETSLWNLFQSKKMRELFALQTSDLTLGVATTVKVDKPAKGPTPLPGREKRIEDYASELRKEEVKQDDANARARKAVEAAEQRLTGLLNEGYPRARALKAVNSELTAARYRDESRAIFVRANAAGKAGKEHSEKAEKHEKKVEDYKEKSEHLHHQADWFDLAELAVELGIVICSVAILSKDHRFWYAGIVLAVIGAILALLGFFPDLFSGGHGAGH